MAAEATEEEVLKELQALIVDDPDLEKLENLLDQFNIFEAIGAIRQEVRHSDFLAFLLNPQQSHGLSDAFVKRLLQRTLSHKNTPITPIDLDLWDLDDLEVRREWQSIDILLVDETHRLVVIVENKVDAGEHSDKLQRYWNTTCNYFPGYTIVGLFLSPDGIEPSNEFYIPINYLLICELVEDLVSSRASTLGQDVITMMRHYAQTLRRHIVGESEIQELCKNIYRRHKQALDMIYEYRTDQQAEIRDCLVELIEQNENQELDHVSKSVVYFLPKYLDFPKLKEGNGWTRSGRIMLFQFTNTQDSLKLYLVLGPGPDETRVKLFDVIGKNEPPFKRSFKALGKNWSTVYNRTFLSKAAYEERNTEELKEDVRKRWGEFLKHDLPQMEEIFLAQDWLKS